MKKINKILVLIICFMPILLNATTFQYSKVNDIVNNYLLEGSYSDNYSKYIITNTNNTKYYPNSTNYLNFINGGLLSKQEYEISNINNNSFLSPGISYWISLYNGKYYTVDYSLKEVSNNALSGVRVTEYVIPEVSVKGKGSINNPWIFLDKYKVSAWCNNSEGTITSDKIVYSYGKPVDFNFETKDGVDYDSNDCGATYTKISSSNKITGKITTKAINKDTSCNIIYKPRTFEITLKDNTTTPKIYYQYNINKYYSNNDVSNKISKLTIPTKDEYLFEGYYSSDGTQYIDENGNFINNLYKKLGNISLTAQWKYNKHVVILHSNYGIDETKEISVLEATISNVLSDILKVNNNYFQRPGYVFKEWSKDSQGNNPLSGSSILTNVLTLVPIILSNESTDLYAQWTPNNYTVSYNGNGSSSGSMTNSTHTYGVAKNLNANGFAKTGYTFAGWATTSTGAVVYANNASVSDLTTTQNATITLYAKWTPNNYTVSYNGNGSSSGSMTNSIHTYGVAKNLNANGFAKTGYVFAGWATTSTGAVVYANNASVSNLTTTQNATVTLYAKWTICPGGTYSNGSTCITCPAGTYSRGGVSSCTSCAKGTYSSAGATSCTSCPSCHTTASTGSTSASQCTWNYGDGSLNTVQGGYQGKIDINCSGKNLFNSANSSYGYTGYNSYNYATDDWNYDTGTHGYCSNDSLTTYGFKRYWMSQQVTYIKGQPTYSSTGVTSSPNTCPKAPLYGNVIGSFQNIYAGYRTYYFSQNVTGEQTIFLNIRGGGGTTGATVSGIQLLIDNSYYTLSSAVANGLIKPLVLLDCGYCDNTLSMYYGSGSTGNWPEWSIMFMTNPGHTYSGIYFYSSLNFQRTNQWCGTGDCRDGLYFRSSSIDLWRMTFK